MATPMMSPEEMIPPRLRARPRYQGLPVPFTAFVDREGVPHFRQVSAVNHRRAMAERLCGLCGAPLEWWVVFHVGPACLKERLVFTAGAHEDCARYALTVCPFLGREDWQRRAEPTLVDPGLMPCKPQAVGLAFVRRYETVRNPSNGMLYAQIPSPHHVEWWRYREGRLVADQVAVRVP